MNDDDQTEQLRGIVGTVLPPDLRDNFIEYTKLDAFRGEDGELDTERVMGHLTAIHVASLSQPQPHQRPGDGGRLEAARRSGRQVNPDNASPASRVRPGAGGRAEAARRNQNRKGQGQ